MSWRKSQNPGVVSADVKMIKAQGESILAKLDEMLTLIKKANEDRNEDGGEPYDAATDK